MVDASHRLEVVADFGADRPYALALATSRTLLVTLVGSGEVALVEHVDTEERLRLAPDRAGQRIDVGEQPGQLVPDGRGSCWCTVTGASQLVRVDVDQNRGLSVGRRVSVPGGPYGLDLDEAGLWFSLLSADALGRLTWSGEVSRTALPEGSFPAMVSRDQGGHPWVALNQRASLARITDGRAVQFGLPAGSAPVGLACAADAVWVADIAGGRVLRVPVHPADAVEERAVSATQPDIWQLSVDSRPHAVIADSGGGCWFTEWGANRLGHIDADGNLVEYDLSMVGTEPHGLVRASGSVLVAMESGAIAKMTP